MLGRVVAPVVADHVAIWRGCGDQVFAQTLVCTLLWRCSVDAIKLESAACK